MRLSTNLTMVAVTDAARLCAPVSPTDVFPRRARGSGSGFQDEDQEPIAIMTPAIRIVERARIAHRVLSYTHDPAAPAYGPEAAAALGLDPRQVFKTLVVAVEGARRGAELAVAVVPVGQQLDPKAAADALGGKRVALAEAALVERTTGYVLGGISPLGQRKRLPTLVDASALDWPEIFVSAGRRGLELALAPADLLQLTEGTTASIAR
jgi:Cys-tRNA(Pro)/Cys-tRNA(Cys) deacylase